MNAKLYTLLIFITFFSLRLTAQNSSIKGKVYDLNTNQALPFVNIAILKTDFVAITDTNGYYRIENIPPGVYNVSCSFIGYKSSIQYEIRITSVKITELDFVLEENATALQEVTVTASPFNKTEESPLSVRTIGSSEIYRSPGGNRDISKVIQSLPGVGSSVSFRNDIIVRGGAPNENRFFLDGIEVPNINHFATQGSSGGPVGMINVNFIREVDFYSGAFPANRGNALSSIMELKQITGNTEKLSGVAMVGSSDIGITLEGPMGKKSDFIFSLRRSYLQFLFKALNLPFLPTYNDLQYKQTIRFKNKSTLTFIGLGAIDDFVLNKSVNDGLSDPEAVDRNNYILGYLPVNTQWNYTAGINYKILSAHGFTSFVVSRNHLNNSSTKYTNNIEEPENLTLKYNSAEIENKVRLERTVYKDNWKFNYGAGYEHALYTNSTFQKIESQGAVVTMDFDSKLPLNKYSAFLQAGKKILNEKVVLSAGIRTDFNDYSDEMNNPLRQISPRFSMSWSLTEKLFLNFNAGRYFQLPPYTVLGYLDSSNTLANKANGVKYIQCDHLVAGIEYNPTTFSKITVEGFYKKYDAYPLLIDDSISLANLGSDFGVIGNEAVSSVSKGQSYGVELFVQQKLSSNYYGILSYTFFRSEFLDKHNTYQPSSWDNGHILNLIIGRKLKKNWEIGMKFRMLGGAPYTPYDIPLSSLKEVWDVTGQGIPDWDKLNEDRFSLSHGLDVRVDKKWFFSKWSLNAYLDIQNLYNFQTSGQPYLNVERDAAGNPVTDPDNPASYKTYLIKNTSGTVLPSIGIMLEF